MTVSLVGGVTTGGLIGFELLHAARSSAEKSTNRRKATPEWRGKLSDTLGRR